jgi:hypothetical protein
MNKELSIKVIRLFAVIFYRIIVLLMVIFYSANIGEDTRCYNVIS